jgi:hypothetical protein
MLVFLEDFLVICDLSLCELQVIWLDCYVLVISDDGNDNNKELFIYILIRSQIAN